jgi:peptidoglycan/xylan/chitin deacetylase (PgdA/CDA1 family)
MVLDVLGQAWVTRLIAAASGPSCVVLMLHRFAEGGQDYWRHDPQRLREVLAALRRADVGFVDLDQVVSAFRSDLRDSPPLPHRLSVAFTLDDGHAASCQLAMPVFAEFDCPVTAFVVPEAVEGRCWFWWDKVGYILHHTTLKSVVLRGTQAPLTFAWNSTHERRLAYTMICDHLKTLPWAFVDTAIAGLAEEAEVDLPTATPRKERVMSWEEMRQAERKGWRFGAHSMTHAVLSRCTDAQSRREIVDSVSVVRKNLTYASEVFCYPVGREQDFGAREMENVKAAGLNMAITAIPGVLRQGMATRHGSDWPLKIPRFSYDDRAGGIPRMFIG